jgi:hypothetical protein
MFFGRKTEKPFQDFRDQLRAIPVQNERVAREAAVEGKELVVTVALKYPSYIRWLSSLLKAERKKRYSLDGLGLQVYRLIDGKRTVDDLIDWLMKEELLTFFEARALILHYLHMLMARGLIVVAVPKLETKHA